MCQDGDCDNEYPKYQHNYGHLMQKLFRKRTHTHKTISINNLTKVNIKSSSVIAFAKHREDYKMHSICENQ